VCQGGRVLIYKVHHIAVIASDYEASKRFYCDVVGFEFLSEVYRAERESWMGKLALNGDYVLELFSFPGSPSRRDGAEQVGLRHLAFEVPSVPAALAELEALGVAHEGLRVDEHTGKQMAFFRDPDRLPLELYEA
jgi:glyoxylase I family protein